MPNNILKIIFIFLIFFKNVSAENVKNIIVKGNERIDSKSVILFSKIKIGDNLDANSLNDITKRIYNTNFFKDVVVNLTDSLLQISVIERVIIQNVRIDGVRSKDLKKQILERTINKNSTPYNEFIVKSDLKLIQNILQSLGYYFSKINALTQDNNNNTIDLVFDIDLGKNLILRKLYL